MVIEVDKIVKTYKTLSQIPALISAKLNSNGLALNSVWTQRNLDIGKMTKFLVTDILTEEKKLAARSFLIDVSQELLSKVSPSENYRAVIRDVDNKDNRKQILEIWSSDNLTHCVDLSALELHGDVYTDGEFGTLEWSPDETKLIYISEKKQPKTEPFYKRKPSKEENTNKETAPIKGQEYLYRQDWGEQLVGKKQSVIAVFHVESEQLEILEGIPENRCPGQVVFAPDGNSVVGIALLTDPRKLGLIYCSNRPSFIFNLDFKGNYIEVSETGQAVKCPRFTPDGKNLVWLQRKAKGPHHSGMTLVKKSFPFNESEPPQVIVDIVRKEIAIANGDVFYGLYNTSFPQRCWASETRLLLSTNQRNSFKSYVVDIDSSTITEIKHEEGSLIVLDVYNDYVLCNYRNFLSSDKLLIAKLPAKGEESSITFTGISKSIALPFSDKLTYEYLLLNQESGSDTVKSFTAIYVGPKTEEDRSVPLIVWPHGGPHSAFANNLFLELSIFMSIGYAVLLVNFRGSIGNGEDSVNSLLGQVGTNDVSDCFLAVKTALNKYKWLNPDKIALVGGSHGGFLVTHLSGQYPDMFKAVVARNPVIDIATASTISDIPDWAFTEAGFDYTQKGPLKDEELLAMRKASPIVHAHKVKAPTLLQVGSKDLRVPPVQALEYYHRLKANGVTVRMNLYEDNHPLGQVPHEMDRIINSVLWIDEHINKS